MKYGSNVTPDIANRLYGDFINWIKENTDTQDSFFGYYMDGEPFGRIGTFVIGIRDWEKWRKENAQLTLFNN